jgi:hypothetical protein
MTALKLAELGKLAELSQLDTRLDQLRAGISEQGSCKQLLLHWPRAPQGGRGAKRPCRHAWSVRHRPRDAHMLQGVRPRAAARAGAAAPGRVGVGQGRAAPGPDGQARGRVAERDHQRQLGRGLHHARDAQPPGQQLRAAWPCLSHSAAAARAGRGRLACKQCGARPAMA